MDDLRGHAQSAAFSGAARVHRSGDVVQEFAEGFANRALGVHNRLDTRFATASATKGLTALCVVALAEAVALDLAAPIRPLLGRELPNIDDAVTAEQLLSHRSGIGDYMDEDAMGDIDDYAMEPPVHRLQNPSDYLPELSKPAQVSAPGERFTYNNSGFVVLSYLIEVLTGSFHKAVVDHVLRPAGVTDGGFFRSDDLPANTALGYLKDGRTNVHHLPVIGAGDGGAYVTLDDVDRFWDSLFAGRVVSVASVRRMTTPHGQTEAGDFYGLGFWLGRGTGSVSLVGMDAGVSFHSAYDPTTGDAHTLLSNTSSGVWPLAKVIEGV
jgi:CubicO group peptidase (beta-lactamase class C family)